MASYIGTKGDDNYTGTASADTFDMSQGGRDTVFGDAGDDLFVFGAELSGHDTVDGGAGHDTLQIDGDYTHLDLSHVTDVETIQMNFKTVDGSLNELRHYDISGTMTMTTNASIFFQRSYHTGKTEYDIDASGYTHNRVYILGGNHNDTLIGGHLADTLMGRRGNDVYQGNDGNDVMIGSGGDNTYIGGAGHDLIWERVRTGHDVFVYNAVSDSDGVTHDKISGFDPTLQKFDLPVAVTGIDAMIVGGHLTHRAFDQDVAAAVDASHLAAHHAVIFDPDSNHQHASTLKYLIIDANGVAGYQGGEDYVIALGTGYARNLDALSVDNFV
jgi:Ca2+-binding RTX toxin-like protein